MRSFAAIVAGCSFVAYLPQATAANALTTCVPSSEFTNVSDCRLDAGNVAFTAPHNTTSSAVFSHGSTGVGYLNLSQVDVAPSASGATISFDPAYSAYAGGPVDMDPNGVIRVVALQALAAPGYQVDSVTIHVEGRVVLGGQASLSAWGLGGTGSLIDFHTAGEHLFDLTATVGAEDLSMGTFPSLYWMGQVPYQAGPGGTAAVYSTLDVSFNKVSFTAAVSAVPEPSTLALGSVALLAMGAVVRGRRAVR